MVKSDKHSIREAKVVAAFVTLGCLVFFIQVAGPQKPPPGRANYVPVPVSVPTPQPSIEERTQAIDPNEQHRGVPGLWVSVDFKHRSYGPYRFYGGRKINLALKNGEYKYDFYENRGWFSFSDVYYVDITGDQIPEALVILSHVECGGSCDGGSDMFFIYSKNADEKLKELFRYETGSYAYGCGLKSLTVKGKELQLELFGRCPQPAMNYPGSGKFMVKDFTQLGFRYHEKGFLSTRTKFLSTDEVDLKNYTPQIYINE
jgi:hypothetical protein